MQLAKKGRGWNRAHLAGVGIVSPGRRSGPQFRGRRVRALEILGVHAGKSFLGGPRGWTGEYFSGGQMFVSNGFGRLDSLLCLFHYLLLAHRRGLDFWVGGLGGRQPRLGGFDPSRLGWVGTHFYAYSADL